MLHLHIIVLNHMRLLPTQQKRHGMPLIWRESNQYMPRRDKDGVQKVGYMSNIPTWLKQAFTYLPLVICYSIWFYSNGLILLFCMQVTNSRYMRDHPCFCEPCRNRYSEGCTQNHTVGCWKPIKMAHGPLPSSKYVATTKGFIVITTTSIYSLNHAGVSALSTAVTRRLILDPLSPTLPSLTAVRTKTKNSVQFFNTSQ